MTEEIHQMTYIEDPSTSIKNPEKCKQTEIELKEKFMVHKNWNMIEDSILKLTI